MKRVPPSVRLKEEINGLLQGAERIAAPAEPPMVGFVGRLARYMLQVAIEAEATAFLGREHYRRGARERVGWRNGYESKHVQSEAGLLGARRAAVARDREPFQPQVRERLRRARPIRKPGAGHVCPWAVDAGRERALCDTFGEPVNKYR